MSYSYSQIKSYLYCPRRYKYQYIDQLLDKSSDILESGIAVHEAIAKDDPAIVANSFEDYVMYLNAKDYLRFVKPIAFEVKLGITENFEPAPFEEAWFRGIIDVIYEGGLLDWKTGQSKPDALQLLLNATLARINGYEINEIVYVYLHSNTSSTSPFTDNMLESTKQMLKEYIEKIENDTEFIPKPSHKCYYCPFAETCADSFGESVEEKLQKYIVLSEAAKRLHDELKAYVKETEQEVSYENYKFKKNRNVYFKCMSKNALKQKTQEIGVFEEIAEIPTKYYETLYKEYDLTSIIKPYIRSSYKLEAVDEGDERL